MKSAAKRARQKEESALNRTQRRNEMRTEKKQSQIAERPLQTLVGVHESGRVIVQYNFHLNNILMPPAEAVRMAHHLILAARQIDPSLAFPKEGDPPSGGEPQAPAPISPTPEAANA